MNQDDIIEKMLSFAREQYAKPYIYGANGPDTYDCSGYVLAILRSAGLALSDMSAQGIYDHFMALSSTLRYQDPVMGALLFFGKDYKNIEHVAFALSSRLMAEAAHGDHTVTTVEEANKRGACVMCRPISSRHDLVCILIPDYCLRDTIL